MRVSAAVQRVFQATWQRCRGHFMRNAMAHAGKQGKRLFAAFIATAFAQDNAEAAKAQWRQVADQIRSKIPKAGDPPRRGGNRRAGLHDLPQETPGQNPFDKPD